MNGENAIDSTCGVSDDELTKRFVEAIRIDNEIKRKKKVFRFKNTIMKKETTVFGVSERSEEICLNIV